MIWVSYCGLLEIFSRYLQAEIAVEKMIHTTTDSTSGRTEWWICVVVFLAQCQLIYRGHILSVDARMICRLRLLQSVQILKIYISQGSVAMRFRCGGIFSECFIAIFLESVSVKE